MYTFDSPVFLYPEESRGECISGQHTICFHILLAFLSKRRADRFLLGWLFLHRRLRSRQRGSIGLRVLSDFCYLSVVPCQKVLSVFIQTTQKSFATLFQAKPFGFDSGCYGNFFSVFCCPQTMRHRLLFAYPCIGQNPVSNLTMNGFYTRFF